MYTMGIHVHMVMRQAQSRQNTRHKFIPDPEKYEKHKKGS